MTARVSKTPPREVRRDNFLAVIEREGRDAYLAGLPMSTCKYNSTERMAWIFGYEQAKNGIKKC